MIKNKFLFYFLSFTWGLLMTLIGCTAALVLIIMGYKPKKWGYCYYFEVGQNWGGVELGIFFITSKNPTTHTKNHEHGHAIQNCWFGMLMPFIVSIPSAARYWYRYYLVHRKQKDWTELPEYNSIWFEGMATSLGNNFIEWLGE